jgi:hypothetical protein
VNFIYTCVTYLQYYGVPLRQSRVAYHLLTEGEQVWVVCIRCAMEVLRTMTMDPSPRERAARSQSVGWLPFHLGSGK